MRVTAPPVRGKANRRVVLLVAKHLGVKRSQVEIVSGHSSRRKTVRIDGVNSDEVRRILAGVSD